MDASTPVDWLRLMSTGLVVTLELTGATILIVVVLSMALALAAISPIRPLRYASWAFCDLFRSIPILVMMFVVYFGFGRQLGELGLSTFWMAVLALSLVESAFLAEIYRGALAAVPSAQWNAASSLGLRWPRAAFSVIVPQALPALIPSTANALIYTLKDSALASLVTVSEVTLVANSIIAETFRPFPVYLVLAGVYLAIIIPLTIVAQILEKRFSAGR